MFVYKKGTLERSVEYLDPIKSKVGIYHKPTKMSLSFVVYNDKALPLKEPNSYPSKSFSDAPFSEMLSVYEVRGMQPDTDKYDFIKDVYMPRKTLVENFMEAIEVFENEIFNRLNEEKPQPSAPEGQTPPTNKVSELPKVGDFVRQGSVFGRVVDVDTETRMVKIAPMDKNEVLSILKLQQNAMREEASEAKFKDGGALEFMSVIVDEQGSNLIILRPTPPSSGGQPPQTPEGAEEQEQEPQDQPDNVEDPFQENDGDGQGQDGQGQDGQGQDGQGQDGQGQDGQGQDGQGQDGEGQDGQGQDGQGQDGEGQDGQGQDGQGQDGEGQDGEGQDGQGQDGQGQDGQGQDGQGQFSEDDYDFDEKGEGEGDGKTIEEIVEEERQAKINLSNSLENMAKDDLERLTRILGLIDLKKDLPSKRAAIKLTQGLDAFERMNEARIINAINFAFK
jgi:hypothetical protein